MQHKPSKRNRELALYSRLPSAKRAFITRWIGRVKPIKKVETVPFPLWAKNRARRDHPTSRRRGDKALSEVDKALRVPQPCRVLCDRVGILTFSPWRMGFSDRGKLEAARRPRGSASGILRAAIESSSLEDDLGAKLQTAASNAIGIDVGGAEIAVAAVGVESQTAELVGSTDVGAVHVYVRNAQPLVVE